ncbi:MAG: methyltransferase domain-containing protein [Rubricoccaceae bacterium]
MDYDPVKDRLGSFFWKSPLRTRVFYRALDAVFLRAWYVRRALRRIARAHPPGEPFRVLDAGTGFGQYAYWLVSRFPEAEVLAVDVKRDYLERAAAFMARTPYRYRVRFAEQDLTAPMAAEAAFDLCLSVDVMEHIEDDRAVFRNFARVLRPGGHVVINTPSDQGGSDAAHEGESFIGEHVRDGYAPADLAARLREAGLEVVEWTYTYGRYGSAAWRLLVKQPIRLLSRSVLLAPVLVPYYAAVGPLGLALNAADVHAEKPTGTGLLMVARRPAGTVPAAG